MTRYIAIDGMGGSGKSYLSERLAVELNAELFHLDDYGDDFKPFIGLPELHDKIKQSKSETIIYEGVGVFNSNFDVFEPFKILVKASDDVRNQRMYSRDFLSTKHSKDEWIEIGKIWNVAECEYFNSSAFDKIDLTVLNDDEMDINFIVDFINKHKKSN